jgi:hypothetical protein
MAARTTRPKSALAALTADEKATVFDQLLAIRPDLRELAEPMPRGSYRTKTALRWQKMSSTHC